jgi:tRNA dimethylallyltransferase
LYLKALLRGMFEGPEADWGLRRSLEADAQSGKLDLYAELASVDPVAAERLHPNDTRRLVRALEVCRLTGKPISELQRQFDDAHPARATRVFELKWRREVLDPRAWSRKSKVCSPGTASSATPPGRRSVIAR